MALIVPRTPMVDDDGSGTIGTIFNNAWKTALYNDIDVGLTPGIQTTALTGTQSITVTSLTRVLRCTNATLLTIQSLPGGFDGQLITITANGAGQVDLTDGGGIANGILGGVGVGISLSLAPGGASPFHNGRAILMWDLAIGRWKVIHHEQGAWIPYTPTWGNLGTANTLGNGSLAAAYRIRGRDCAFRLTLTWGTTTVSGNNVWTLTFPFTLSAALNTPMLFPLTCNGAAGSVPGHGRLFSPTVWVPYAVGAPTGVTGTVPFTWGNTHTLMATGGVELS